MLDGALLRVVRDEVVRPAEGGAEKEQLNRLRAEACLCPLGSQKI